MNEIDKLYEIADLANMWVEEYDGKQHWYSSYECMIKSMMEVNDWSRSVAVKVAKTDCRKDHKPFTAEVQLKLLDYIYKRKAMFVTAFSKDMGGYICVNSSKSYDTLAEAIAYTVNYLWSGFSNKDKKVIRGILSGQDTEIN